ncbi:MAG: sugar phosphate nucleotidyltransferase [Planctomycetota bacterium]
MQAIRKAVITAAAPDQNRLPLQQLVDRHGRETTALGLIIDEAVDAGIEEICVVIQPGDHEAYESAATGSGGKLHFAYQDEPLGYADAILRAEKFIDGQPFLHSVGDHVYLSASGGSCAKQLIDIASARRCSVSAVQATRENNLAYFGIVSGPHLPRESRLYEVQRVVEKPTPTRAEQELTTPGLRAGYYLGFFGMHVLAPEVLPLLHDSITDAVDRKATLSDALSRLPGRGQYLAARLSGSRYNLGIQYGLLKAQLAIALAGQDRDQILSELVELLAIGPASSDAPMPTGIREDASTGIREDASTGIREDASTGIREDASTGIRNDVPSGGNSEADA